MKAIQKAGALALLLALALSGCGQAADAAAIDPADVSAAGPQDTAEPLDSHAHQPLAEPHVIEDNSPDVWCGNTAAWARPAGEEERYRFWGEDAIALTDLLLTLDYSEGVCRCMPEYTVDTEMEDGYGVSLSGYYVRYDGAQAELTEEQAELIRDILTRNMTQEHLEPPREQE